MSATRRRLRELIDAPEVLVVPGVSNALHAKIAERVGFSAVNTTGAGIANSLLGVPDVGLTTMTETAMMVRYIAGAVPLPVIADADTGYGNHINVTRTISELEAGGAAGILLEDQAFPKRCGHFEGKRVVTIQEGVERIVAAIRARRDPDLVIIARTDALAVEGFDAALDRARAYVAAGADAIFIEAPEDPEQMASIPRELGVPCVANMVEGGKTPLRSADELKQLGFSVVLYGNLALRASNVAVERVLRVLKDEGTSQSVVDEIQSWSDRQAIVGLEDWDALDSQVADQAAAIVAASAAG